MKTVLLPLAIAVSALTGSIHAAADFESPGVVPASRFLPANLMNGPLHRVGESAYNDGLRNTYFIFTSNRGDIEVSGSPAAAQRIREIYAIERLQGASRGDEFAKGLADSAKGKVESVVGIVKDPVGTIASVPKGASRFFGRVGEGLKGGKSQGQESALSELTGVAKAKQKLAAQLGVNPYSTNEELQQQLTSVARASAAGGLTVSLATAAVGGTAGDVVSILGVNETLQNALVNSSPADLRAGNRRKLQAIGASAEQADRLLMHPWFSPWSATIMTDALSRIGAKPTVFLEEACRAMTPEDAFYFQRLAQILAVYHESVAPLRALRVDYGLPTALDRDGILVVPVSLDYAIWSERVAGRVEEFKAAKIGKIKGFALWTDGLLSDRLCKELAQRQIGYRMQALGKGR